MRGCGPPTTTRRASRRSSRSGRRSTRGAERSVTTRRWIGQPVKRVEDARLLSGRGNFIDDLTPCANVHHAAIVRSPHAHARILGYEVSAALGMEGVIGVITGADVARLTRPFSVGVTAPVSYYSLATDKARFVGEPVAVVVARNRYLAEDAAEAVIVRYEPLPAVVDVERALEPDAPVLHEAVGSNLAGHRRPGSPRFPSSGSRTGASTCSPRRAAPIASPTVSSRPGRMERSSVCATAGSTTSAGTSGARSPDAASGPAATSSAPTAFRISRSTTPSS